MSSDKGFDQVLLVRHGQTEWNVLGRRQGRHDSPLTPAGAAQAHRTAAEVTGDAIFSSPLGRALTTARVIAAATSLPLTVLDDLTEVDHGDFTGLSNEDLARDHPTELAARNADKYHYRFPNGESYADADRRAARVLTAVTGRCREPVFVSHEMIGRMLLKNLLGFSAEEVLARRQPNDVIHVVRDGELEIRAVPATSPA